MSLFTASPHSFPVAILCDLHYGMIFADMTVQHQHIKPEASHMKQIMVECEHCEQCIQPHHLFRREGKVFYHSLCWELLLLDVEKAVYQHKAMQNGEVYAARQ